MLRNYDPKKNIINFAGILIGGYADGDFVTVEMNEEAFTATVGADGEVVRTQNHNEMAKATITLLAASPTNDRLSIKAIADRNTGLGYGVFQLEELTGTTLVHGTDAWISKRPSITRGKEAPVCVWEITIAKCDIFAGGAVL